MLLKYYTLEYRYIPVWYGRNERRTSFENRSLDRSDIRDPWDRSNCTKSKTNHSKLFFPASSLVDVRINVYRNLIIAFIDFF